MVMRKDGVCSEQFMKPKLIALLDTFFFLGLSSFLNPTTNKNGSQEYLIGLVTRVKKACTIENLLLGTPFSIESQFI